MTEATKSTLMIVASLIAGMIVIVSGFFMFSNFIGDITEQRQSNEFAELQGQISRICQEIKLNPNNLFAGEQFSMIVYEPYRIWYEKVLTSEVQQVCDGARCVCFGRTTSPVPSDCFSLDRMECPTGADIKYQAITGKQLLHLLPMGALGIELEATCKYTARITWDRVGLFMDITQMDATDDDIVKCGPYPEA
jgi:hypothetical protein